MRGLLKITSARVPFMRAGVAFPTTAPVELHITQLDGERLLRLIREPVLTIQMSDGDGKFQPLPPLDKDVSAEDLQRTIDRFADDAPPVVLPPVEVDPAELLRLREVDAAFSADQRHIFDQGFQSLDALTSAWAIDRAALNQLQADGITQGQALAAAQARIVELEAQIADQADTDPDRYEAETVPASVKGRKLKPATP